MVIPPRSGAAPTLHSELSTLHSKISTLNLDRMSTVCPFSSKSIINRGSGFRASAIALWLSLNSAHDGVHTGSLCFSSSSPFSMRSHISFSQGSFLKRSQSSRLAGRQGAPCPLPMVVKYFFCPFTSISFPPSWFSGKTKSPQPPARRMIS